MPKLSPAEQAGSGPQSAEAAGRARLFMCRPDFFGVDYVINPWMEGNVGRAKSERATAQWNDLRAILSELADIEVIDPAEGLPDMPFTANAGLVHDGVFIPARFRFPQRQAEAAHFTRWFAEHDYHIVELSGEGTYEGEGDSLFQPGRPLLWCGYGVRTSLQVYRDIGRILGVEAVPLRLVDERFYHLDTCFCPLSGGRAFYYPEAFDRESLAEIRAYFGPDERIEIGDEDALGFACNAVEAGGTIVCNRAGPALRARLEAWGFTVKTTPLDEFMLAGGAAKCLTLLMTHPAFDPLEPDEAAARPGVAEQLIQTQGHLLETGVMNEMLDFISDAGCSFEIERFRAGIRKDQESFAAVRVVAPSQARLEEVLARLIEMGARIEGEEAEARLGAVEADGVAPMDFYATTIFPTDVRIGDGWARASGQRMDAMIVVSGRGETARADCRLMRDLKRGDRVVCGVGGIRLHVEANPDKSSEVFGFMSSGVSSERRVEIAVDEIAWEMRRLREREGRIVVVAGPVTIHTGGGPHLAALIRMGYVQALLGGNAIAVHDIEQALFGTSLGVDLRRGNSVHGGHRHHLHAINLVRAHGSIEAAVEAGAIPGGVMYECVKGGVPFCLAGSIRDDGPLPETRMDLIQAQREYAELIEGADMILMFATMLHSIGVGNMTPAGVRLICVDINQAMMTKLADRGSVESTGVVTDVGLFLNLLRAKLENLKS